MKWECLKNNKWNRYAIVDVETKAIFDVCDVLTWEYDDKNNVFVSFSCIGGIEPNLKNLKFAQIFCDEIEILQKNFGE